MITLGNAVMSRQIQRGEMAFAVRRERQQAIEPKESQAGER